MRGDLLSSFFTLHLIVNVEVTYLFDDSVGLFLLLMIN